jgi:hypothetical protein
MRTAHPQSLRQKNAPYEHNLPKSAIKGSKSENPLALVIFFPGIYVPEREGFLKKHTNAAIL